MQIQEAIGLPAPTLATDTSDSDLSMVRKAERGVREEWYFCKQALAVQNRLVFRLVGYFSLPSVLNKVYYNILILG